MNGTNYPVSVVPGFPPTRGKRWYFLPAANAAHWGKLERHAFSGAIPVVIVAVLKPSFLEEWNSGGAGRTFVVRRSKRP